MSKAGESYWRLHVELQTLPSEQRDGADGASHRERMAALWEALSEQDRAEVNERLRIAKGE